MTQNGECEPEAVSSILRAVNITHYVFLYQTTLRRENDAEWGM